MSRRSLGKLAGALLFLSAAGCRPASTTPSPADYPRAYKALMAQFGEKVRELTSRPLPERTPATPAAEYRAQVAQQVQDMADAAAGFQAALDRLQPPGDYEEVHAATRSLFTVQEEGHRKWAAAIRTGNRTEAEKATKEKRQAEKAALLRMKGAVDALGIAVPVIDEALRGIEAAEQPRRPAPPTAP
jgi:hypothetical protein